jgi:hypothetical protein
MIYPHGARQRNPSSMRTFLILVEIPIHRRCGPLMAIAAVVYTESDWDSFQYRNRSNFIKLKGKILQIQSKYD